MLLLGQCSVCVMSVQVWPELDPCLPGCVPVWPHFNALGVMNDMVSPLPGCLGSSWQAALAACQVARCRAALRLKRLPPAARCLARLTTQMFQSSLILM